MQNNNILTDNNIEESLDIQGHEPDLIPTQEEVDRIVASKEFFEKNAADIRANPSRYKKGKAWAQMPWAIAWSIWGAQDKYKLARILLLAIILNWHDLIDQLKRTAKNLQVVKRDLTNLSITVWKENIDMVLKMIENANKNIFNENLNEDIEKHDELNPKLWEDWKLKPEVKEKIELIVNEFLDGLKEDEISIDVDDILIIGSNASFNWTKDSDLDVHIIVKHIEAPEDLYPKLYSAYRSLFNKKLDIEFYGIPVELYIETDGTPRVSNGVYSVINDEWIKEPVKEDIPEIDKEALDKSVKEWEDRYNKIVDSSEEKLDESMSEYKGYTIDYIPGYGPYSIQIDGDDMLFDTEEEAKTYIDSLGTEELHEDLDDAKSIIADQIRGEWEAIKNYEKAVDDLSKINGNFSEIMEILNDIADEEEVHCGELEKAQSLIDANLLANIEDGKSEVEADITENESPVEESMKLTETPDIFGIETDDEIDREADARKLAAHQKRKEIIDGDILTELHNNRLGDEVALGKTLADKKQIIINFINSEIPRVRKGPNYRGVSDFAYNPKYKDKLLDQEMVKKFADYYTDYWKNNDRIKKYRVYDKDSSWINKPITEKLELNESSWFIKDCQFNDGYYLECRWDKYNGYEVIGGDESDGLVYDDFQKSYPTKEAAVKAFERYKKQFIELHDGIKSERTESAKNESLNEAVEGEQLTEIDQFLEDIYELRKEGLTTGSEFDLKNLTFKEIRNRGYLDNLKDLRNQLVGKELSLESLEQIVDQDLSDNRQPAENTEEEILAEPVNYKQEIAKEKGLIEDTEKVKDHKWVNHGKEGTHGEFRTKKEADAQRKAMFANGFMEDYMEDGTVTPYCVIYKPWNDQEYVDYYDNREEPEDAYWDLSMNGFNDYEYVKLVINDKIEEETYFKKPWWLEDEDEKLTEASLDYSTQENKMDRWHDGARGANVASMSNEKLELNHRICLRKGYNYEATVLEAEGRKRGLAWASKAIQSQAPKTVLPKLDIMDFHPTDGSFVKDNALSPKEFIKDFGNSKADSVRQKIIYLIWAIILKQTHLVDIIKNNLVDEEHIDIQDLKNVINETISNSAIAERIESCAKDIMTEGLVEEQAYTRKDLNDLKIKIWQMAKSQPIIQDNGRFDLYNIPESDVNFVVQRLNTLDFVKDVQKVAGKFDYSKSYLPGNKISRKYNVYGYIKDRD